MDSISNCRICYEPFSEDDRIPKIFLCGHTFCIICIRNFEGRCPMCKKEIVILPGGWPTNFVALQASEEAKRNSPAGRSFLATSLRTLERKYLNRRETLISRRDAAYEKTEEQDCLLSVVTSCIPRIRAVLTVESQTWNTAETKKLIFELEHNIDKVDMVMKYWKSHAASTYSIDSYIGTKPFLYDIANRLHQGEEIFAYEVVENKYPRYGKITLMKDRIFISAFDISSVDKETSIISFRDLKKCITRQNLKAHLKIGQRSFNFDLKWSSLTSRFIKMCTGENGPMFKGVRVQATSPGNCLIIESQLNDLDFKGLLDYFDACSPLNEEKTYFEFSTIVIRFPHHKRWEIRQYKQEEVGLHVVAQMADLLSIPLNHSNGVEISDSGISLTIQL